MNICIYTIYRCDVRTQYRHENEKRKIVPLFSAFGVSVCACFYFAITWSLGQYFSVVIFNYQCDQSVSTRIFWPKFPNKAKKKSNKNTNKQTNRLTSTIICARLLELKRVRIVLWFMCVVFFCVFIFVVHTHSKASNLGVLCTFFFVSSELQCVIFTLNFIFVLRIK